MGIHAVAHGMDIQSVCGQLRDQVKRYCPKQSLAIPGQVGPASRRTTIGVVSVSPVLRRNAMEA